MESIEEISARRTEHDEAISACCGSTSLPLCSSGLVAAGFPSPADDYLDKQLDLNRYLIRHPAATFLVRAVGDSMIGAGIHSGDLLIVDRSLEPVSNRVVIAVLDGELTVKRLRETGGKVYLMPENDQYEPIEVGDNSDFEVWGVVTAVIHPL